MVLSGLMAEGTWLSWDHASCKSTTLPGLTFKFEFAKVSYCKLL